MMKTLGMTLVISALMLNTGAFAEEATTNNPPAEVKASICKAEKQAKHPAGCSCCCCKNEHEPDRDEQAE